MELKSAPAVNTGLLIRRPAAEVFEAFADPAVTSKFWFSKGSGRLEPDAKVRWDWEMYGASAEAVVKALDPGRRILIDWGDESEGYTQVEWRFEPRGDDKTFVTVVNSGFTGTGDEQVSKALDSIGGFNLVLAGAKAWLEHGLQLNLVPDRHPEALVKGWKAPPG